MCKFVCSKCGHKEDVSVAKMKCDCGGLWELDYVPPKFSPELIDKDNWSLFRYRKFMPITGETWREVTLGEGMIPIIPYNKHTVFKMGFAFCCLLWVDIYMGMAWWQSHTPAFDSLS